MPNLILQRAKNYLMLLGENSEEIANTLRSLGIKGYRCSFGS